LLDEHGGELPHAFLDLPGGLWNDDGTILTLLLHPGRIKSGLAGHETLGPALFAGREYVVEIDIGAFFDGAADQLEHYKLAVGKAETRPLDAAQWIIGPVAVNTRDALSVKFDRALDWRAIQSGLAVVTADNSSVAGHWSACADGKSAEFVPDSAWIAMDAQLRLAPDLEDTAGNRRGESFEQPIGAPHRSR